MKKIILTMILMFLMSVGMSEAKGKPWLSNDSFDVEANTLVPVEGNVLEEGVKYKVVVSGTYFAGDNIEADALCSFRSTSSSEWTDLVSNYESYGQELLDLMMNGESEWGTECKADHIYSRIVVGDGTAPSFFINDVYSVNNTGNLQVKIYEFTKGKSQVSEVCSTIQSGDLEYSSGHYLEGKSLVTGYDDYGYNYQAHMFYGSYANAYLGRGPNGYPPYQGDDDSYLSENPNVVTHWAWEYRNEKLMMKWSDSWLANTDCDDDGKLDRHYGNDSYIGSGAWLTNHMWGEEEQKWNYFTKIVAAPSDAEIDNETWVSADSSEIGSVIWGQFATIQEISNDPGTGDHGLLYKGARPSLGGWEN